jgi:aspartate aminotransferase
MSGESGSRLTRRALELGESATFKVARRARELRAAGQRVYDFSVGEPDFSSPTAAVEGARAALADGLTRYTAVAGLPTLRESLARGYAQRYGADWPAERFVVTVGAKAALFELALSLFEPGCEVVVPTPAWVSIPAQVGLAGAAAVAVPMDAGDSFRLHADRLLAACTARTSAVILNAPCNPTGGVISAEDLTALTEGCAERGMVLIADETYERYVYDAASTVSAAALARRFPETVIVVGSFSKTWAMTGWRLGWVVGPAAVIRAVTAVQGHITSNPTSFAMHGALRALEVDDDEFAAHLREFQERRDLVVDRLNSMPGVSCGTPAGAFYAFPRVAEAFRAGRRGSLEFAQFLLESAGVAVVPGSAFGADEHIRLSFACSRETLEEGLTQMEEALAAGSG